ncbi:MAG: arsenosugar biosynthesis radical SAM protein ArsS [Candidatus Omnitrophica bacterium]|nr:arsenosugar biosynthesis radical SAM protein ArsS [Candidatus Omnitrophota bacterium]
MNAFINALDQSGISLQDPCLKRTDLTTLQINMGNLCNQSCMHCHVGASPEGNKIMSKQVIDAILRFLLNNKGLILDITGGAPELNPDFDYLIKNARPLVQEIIVRSNLSVIFEPGKEYLPEFFKKHKIHLICSLPCYGQDNVDAQRGEGVFKKSIKALQKLNKLGYAKKAELALDLVYNPSGAFLPQQQAVLQKAYSEQLKANYNIDFNRLVTITNVPIKRFKDYLNSRGEYSNYIDLLRQNFNPEVVCGIMCRKFLSIGYDGRVYDCDFNQSLGWMLKDVNGNPLMIDKLDLDQLKNRDIQVGEHCLSCTAGYGSSCQGALSKENDKLK